MTGKKRLGDLGERIAAEYLERNGHVVIEGNWRSSHLEVDIITTDRDGIHFVEVKTRTAPVAANPVENVNYHKQKNIRKAAADYVCSRYAGDNEIFFDIVTVVFEGDKVEIDYIRQAYIPIYV